MKLFLSSMALFLIVTGCATTGGEVPKMTPAQEDALARLAGNGIAETLRLVKPEYLIPAKTFCALFNKAENAIEAKSVLENALTFLSDKYTEGDRLGRVVMNALTVIGYDEGQIEEMLFKKAEETVKLKAFNEEMFRKARLVVEGFCQMI